MTQVTQPKLPPLREYKPTYEKPKHLGRELVYFDRSEFDCKHTGLNRMDESSLFLFDELRHRCGFSFHVLSGYRDPKHPQERHKRTPGTHAQGIAGDFRVNGGHQRRTLVEQALLMGVFGGIGVAKGFVLAASEYIFMSSPSLLAGHRPITAFARRRFLSMISSNNSFASA